MFLDCELCPRLGQPRDPNSVVVAALTRPSRPLVAMITAVAKTTMTPVKIRNLAVFEAGAMSRDSWLIEASKLAWKIATSSTLNAVTL